jgi:WD40 repeat protein
MAFRLQIQNRKNLPKTVVSCMLSCLLALLLSSCATAPPADKVDNYWDGYTTVAISPNGKIVAAANRHIVVLFDIEQQRQVGWFWATDAKGKGFRLPRTGLGDTMSFIDDYRIVTTGMGGLATVWDIRTGQKELQIDPVAKGMYGISLAWSPITSHLAVGTWDGSVLVYKFDEGEFGDRQLLNAHIGRVNDLVFSADGKYMASAGDDKSVYIWDMETLKWIGKQETKGEISDLEVVSSRRSLIIAGDDVTIWKFLTEEEAVELKEDKAIGQWVGTGALYALQAGLLVTGLGGGISTHDPANCGRFTTVSPDGKFLVDVKPGPMSNKVTVLDVELNEILREVDVPDAICDLEFTADGTRLVLAGDGGMFLVDTATWKRLPMNLIVDAFSHAPGVKLAETGYMGLDVTGHRPKPASDEEPGTAAEEADSWQMDPNMPVMDDGGL